MTITLISNSTVKVALTEKDMQNYNMDFERLDRESTATKLFLLKIINEIRNSNDIELSKEKLYVEAFRQGSGGCLIYISIGSDKFRPREKPFRELIYEFCNLTELIRISSLLWKNYNHLFRTSELYCSEKSYRLIVKALSKTEDKLCSILGEYGNRIDSDEIILAATREHCSTLIEKNAVETLASIS